MSTIFSEPFFVCVAAKKGADEEQRLSQLKLALTWDRVDIAQEEIFREDVLWSTGTRIGSNTNCAYSKPNDNSDFGAALLFLTLLDC